MVIAFVYPPENDRESSLVQTWKLHPYWLTSTVLGISITLLELKSYHQLYPALPLCTVTMNDFERHAHWCNSDTNISPAPQAETHAWHHYWTKNP